MDTKDLKYYSLIVVAITLMFFISCEEEEPVENEIDIAERELTSEDVFSIMFEWYYWYTSISDNNIDLEQDPGDMLEDLRYEELDRWSYISTSEEFTQYYSAGQYVGYGFSYKWHIDGTLRIAFVFQDSPFYEEGIKRGWRLIKINEQELTPDVNISELLGEDEIDVTNNFLLEDDDGNQKQYTFSKKLITMNTVLYRNIYIVEDKNVGYLVLKSFIEPSFEELENTFTYFNENNVHEVIIDLRYNGGGRTDVSRYLAGLIAGTSQNGQILTKYIHNDKKTENNFATAFEGQDNSLSMDRIFFITTQSTASASESLINGLKPYIEVKLVGNKTYGKPVGMYSFEFKDLTLVPISFSLKNALNEGDYYDGLNADSYIEDDLTRPFGDENERCLKETLHYISTGTFTGSVSPTKSLLPEYGHDLHGLRFEIGAY